MLELKSEGLWGTPYFRLVFDIFFKFFLFDIYYFKKKYLI